MIWPFASCIRLPLNWVKDLTKSRTSQQLISLRMEDFTVRLVVLVLLLALSLENEQHAQDEELIALAEKYIAEYSNGLDLELPYTVKITSKWNTDEKSSYRFEGSCDSERYIMSSGERMVRLTKRSLKLGNIPQPELPEDLDSWTAYRSFKQFRAPNNGDKLNWKELHSDDKGDDLFFPNEEQLPFVHWNSLWNGATVVSSPMRCYAARMEDGVLVSCWKYDEKIRKSRLLKEISFKEGLPCKYRWGVAVVQFENDEIPDFNSAEICSEVVTRYGTFENRKVPMRVELVTFDGQLFLKFHATLSWNRGVSAFVEREFENIDREIAKTKTNTTADPTDRK